jgi:hypothetical protein
MSETSPISHLPRWLAVYWPPKASIYKQIIEEFWLPTVVAVFIAAAKYYLLGGDFWALFGAAWVVAFFWTNAYVRISRQQTQDTAIDTVGKQVQKIGLDVISISEKFSDPGEVELCWSTSHNPRCQPTMRFEKLVPRFQAKAHQSQYTPSTIALLLD